LVRFLVGNDLNDGFRARSSPDALRELHDRDFVGAADVVDLSNGCVALGELDERTHDVRYVAEAPRLVARAVDRDGLVLEGLTGERGQHHAVLPGLARSDRIEEADHGGGKAALLPVGDGEELVDELTRGIAPATLVRWT